MSEGVLKRLGVRVLRLDAKVAAHPAVGVAPVLALLLQCSIRDGLELYLGTFPHWDTDKDDLGTPSREYKETLKDGRGGGEGGGTEGVSPLL